MTQTDWTLFTSCVGFKLAKLIFRGAKLSRSHVDRLMDLWAALMIEVGGVALFVSSEDLLDQIDQIKLGHVPWYSFTAAYSGDESPRPDSPLWMREEYEVWFRDPREIVHNIIGNPKFLNSINYIPYRDFTNGKWRWSEFMSGDWAWEQAVRVFPYSV